MPEPDLCLLFVRPLNRLGFQYMVSGGVAAIVYGEPRLTNAVDIVVFLGNADVPRFYEVFAPPEFYVPPVEVIAAELARPGSGQFNVIHVPSGFKADFYILGRDELDAWAFGQLRRLQYQGERMVVAPPEYVVVRKLEFYRDGGSEKPLRDIRAMLAVSGHQIDRVALDRWIRSRGLLPQWQKLSP